MARLVPELDVTSLEGSLAFYVGVLGFAVVFERPEEKFAFLDLDGAELMLEQAAGPAAASEPLRWRIHSAVASTFRSRLPMSMRWALASPQPG